MAEYILNEISIGALDELVCGEDGSSILTSQISIFTEKSMCYQFFAPISNAFPDYLSSIAGYTFSAGRSTVS